MHNTATKNNQTILQYLTTSFHHKIKKQLKNLEKCLCATNKSWSILDACDLQALRWHRIKNQPDSVLKWSRWELGLFPFSRNCNKKPLKTIKKMRQVVCA